MKDKLERGMYVRTKKGNIYKFKTNNSMAKNGAKKYMVNCSYNLIDLIEVGDYVNGSKVYYCYCADEDSTGLFIDTEKGRQWLDKPSQVKSIVTKEMFSSVEYRMETD